MGVATESTQSQANQSLLSISQYWFLRYPVLASSVVSDAFCVLLDRLLSKFCTHR